MKRRKLVILGCLLFICPFFCQAQKVSLEIIDTNSIVKVYDFDWPFSDGPQPVGSEKSFIKIVDGILVDNNIDCPPKREKVSDHVWLCGNGKKIRTQNTKLANLLSKAWDQ
jgi:coenzyme F420-reducing hydrogenase gamma subunit